MLLVKHINLFNIYENRLKNYAHHHHKFSITNFKGGQSKTRGLKIGTQELKHLHFVKFSSKILQSFATQKKSFPKVSSLEDQWLASN